MTGSPLRHINGYLIEHGDGYLLVDCGWDTADVLEGLEAGLRELGVDIQDVRTLVVTHFHPDHYGMAGTVVKLSHGQLMMSRVDWAFVRDHMSQTTTYREETSSWLALNGVPPVKIDDSSRRMFENVQRFSIVPPARELEDDDVVGSRDHSLRVVW